MPNLTLNVPPKPTVVTIQVPGAQGPKGDKGDPNTLSIGTVTGDVTAAATITGTAPNQVLSLTLPQGPQGNPGDLMTLSPSSAWTGNVDLSTLTAPYTAVRTLSGNTTITVLPTAPAAGAGTVTLIAKQAASGGPFTLTWPSTLEWNNNAAAPAMPTAANSELIVSLFWMGAWRAAVVGIYYP